MRDQPFTSWVQLAGPSSADFSPSGGKTSWSAMSSKQSWNKNQDILNSKQMNRSQRDINSGSKTKAWVNEILYQGRSQMEVKSFMWVSIVMSEGNSETLKWFRNAIDQVSLITDLTTNVLMNQWDSLWQGYTSLCCKLLPWPKEVLHSHQDSFCSGLYFFQAEHTFWFSRVPLTEEVCSARG